MPKTRAVLEQRWERLRASMQEAGLDGLLVAGRGVLASYGYVVYVAGFTPIVRSSYVLLRPTGEPTLWLPNAGDVEAARERSHLQDVRSTDEMASDPVGPPMAVAVAEEITKHRLRSVGIAGLSAIVSIADEHLLRDSAPGVELVDATSLLQDAKELKSADDVAGSRRALELALSAYVHAPDLLTAGTRAQDVVAELERVLRAGGATELLVFVEAGPHVPQRVTDTTFSDGDLVTVLIEAADRHGYWVEVGGLFALGQLSPAAQNLADASYEALDAVRQRSKPGTPVAELSETVSGIASKRGLEVQLGLGHGVGIDHDRPTLSPRSDELVREGHLLSVHPSMWDPREQIATMVADAFWVEAAGATRLTNLRYETTVLS